MKLRRLASLALAVLMSTAVLGFAAGPVAATCGGATNQHVYVQRHADENTVSGTYMEVVSGQVTIRTLDTECLFFSGNAVLPANLQQSGATDNLIFQLGYARLNNGAMKFYYAYRTPDALEWPEPAFALTVGDPYRFDIKRGALEGYTGYIIYRITNLETGASSTLIKAQTWSQSFKKAWWGGERLTNTDEVGVDAGESALILRYMCYRTEYHPSCVYRSGMTSGEVHDTATDSAIHGHITNWVYGGDGLQLETH